ncbi:hypothetical protein BVC80_9029g7 [Macleaya cordata]|uniref:Uncharacterized protein n=1 Tax=Macleaya cordata TaxID=56857 RepID=A0A200QUP6_MACCD|nr:hypothetical protein BVC80_9029g7 [Macleaya cordata]
MDQDLDDDLVSEFRDLPSKFHQTLIPDLERMSTTSKAYITKANKEITEGFKPLVGLEPLKFFYATSQSSYVCLQVLQTLGYVLYLLLLLMYLVLVFSTETGLGCKVLGLGQTFVGFAVGLHYYVTVFHRAVLNQPPKTNWKVHGIYATCFLLICVLSGVDRRKKAYLEDGGDEGKKS